MRRKSSFKRNSKFLGKKGHIRRAAGSLAAVMVVLACGGCTQTPDENMEMGEPEEVVVQESQEGAINEEGRYETIGNLPIHDNKSLYDVDDDFAVETMYLTIQKGNASDGTDHTWQEINEHSVYYYEEQGIERYKTEAILKVGDENGPVLGEYGYTDLTPNATVCVRGQTSSRGRQKNYKIKIKDGKGSYKDQTIINLNKHVGESLRFRNKLCYDLMEELPGMMSARTQFVHLYVKDMTAENPSGEYEDYGLYTQVEQINKTYLKNHGLDNKGQLYKINFFEFYRYEDVIKLNTDAGYDEKAFERYIEIKGDTDHSKLIAMLDDLNNDMIPIEETFAKWFDEDNVFSWLAFHILVGNKDTQARNCFIYSPLNVDKWYFISWDNDAALMDTERDIAEWKDGDEWQVGISNYWGNVLFRKVLKSDQYRAKLDDKINEYRAFLTKERIQEMAQAYDEVVRPYVERMPDVGFLPRTLEEREQIKNAIADEVEQNYQLYLKSLEDPQPFFIGVPERSGEGIHVTWDASYDFANEDITYTVELARDYYFQDPIFYEDDIFVLELTIPQELEPGAYFLRVKATDESGNSQYAFDTYMASTGSVSGNEYGIKCFYVLEDGSIVEDIYEE